MTRPEGTQLIGRAEPRRRLERTLAAAVAGHRSVGLVSGEAGMGKTSLIRSALERDTSSLVGWGTCWHGEGAPGFWPWMQAFDDLYRSVGPTAAVAAAGADRDLLAVLVRGLGPATETTEDPDRRRLLLLDAAVRWLEALAADQNLVVVLDDLQWADPSTLDLLDQVVAAAAPARLTIVGAFRHDELDARRRERLAGLSSHTENVHLEGLGVDAVEELVAGICGPDRARHLAADLHRRTGGHPLFVGELARLPDVGGRLPTAVAGALARRVEGLPPATRQVLVAGSVLGNRLLPDVLALVIDETPLEVVELLEVAQTGGVVRSGPDGEIWFAHDLYRETLYDALSAGARADLHGRVGKALLARQARGTLVPPGALARHFTQAITSTGPDPAVHWAQEASREERRRAAFSESAAHLRRVRAAAADGGCSIDPDLLVGLLIEEADAQARSGEPQAARLLLAEAAAAASGPGRQADVALAVQRLGAKFAAPRDEIIRQLENALVAITGQDPARQARVTAALARELQHSVAQERSRAGRLSEEALRLGRRAGDDETLADCLLARHDALWEPGTGVARSELAREIAHVGARLGDTDRLAEGLILEANALLETGSPAFRPVLDRWFGLLESRNELRDRYLVKTRRAALALLEGDGDAAESLMYAAAELGRTIHEPDTGNVLMSQRVALARVRNDPAELATLAEDAVRWWTGAPVLAHAVAAGARAASGDLESAAREVAMLAEAGGWRSEGSYLRSVLVADLAVAVTAVHDAELCALLLDDIRPLADACGVNGAVVAFAGPFAHAAGILAAELGDRPLAHTMLRRSVDTARALGASVWVREGEAALRSLGESEQPQGATEQRRPGATASMSRAGNIWTVSFGDERGQTPHVKGMADLARLLGQPGQEVPALQLAGGTTASPLRDELTDPSALQAYRRRLVEIQEDLEAAEMDADLARSEQLTDEREQLLVEVRRTTGLGGRIRGSANDPAERARKAVSGRIRDAIRRLGSVTPDLAAHLDRSIHTGLRCCYAPVGDEARIRWRIEA